MMKEILTCVVAALIAVLLVGVSWITTAGISVLAARCLGYNMTINQGTGIWLALSLLSVYFKPSKDKSK